MLASVIQHVDLASKSTAKIVGYDSETNAYSFSRSDGNIIVSVPLRMGENNLGSVVFAYAPTSINKEQVRLFFVMTGLVLVFSLLSCIGAWYVSSIITHPIDQPILKTR